ncbi:putative transcription factor bHLH family [Medicago truncatula]|uniref:Transcription factor n=1 Tax=Medicago truncatula TaxID=3880 RepID=G7ID49_MEDTR|nr:transcription factor bHLH118 isoform X2 [Medicago truncatula]AES62639.2 transcription factor [Medicago truncatula]RHN81928.1 putative transcription factor bHLH family [Medicago truncatula]
MFPLQRCNELAKPLSNSLNHHQHHKISEDLILDDCDSLVIDFSLKKMDTNRPPNKLFYIDRANHGSNRNSIEDKKKMVHREIEKQRRQEMATLHTSLRSLLPLHFIKGKRSLSDQMNEAVNYINHLKKNMKELSYKRDELKKLSNPSLKNKSHVSCSFTIHKNNRTVGIEISTKTGFIEEGAPLSKFLEQLMRYGLDVVSCFSIQVNGKLLHSVQCEVINSDSVDLTELRRNLSNLNPSFSCSD